MKTILPFAILSLLAAIAFAAPEESDTYSGDLSRNAMADVPVGPHAVFHVTSDADETTATLKVARHAVAIDLDLTRHAAVLVPKMEPRIVLIHECFASNEDRIQIIDARKDEAKTYKLQHDDAADYIHVDYAVSGKLVDKCLEVTETQYAGSQPPRARIILVPLNKPSEFRVAAWHAIDDDDKTATRPTGKVAAPTAR